MRIGLFDFLRGWGRYRFLSSLLILLIWSVENADLYGQNESRLQSSRLQQTAPADKNIASTTPVANPPKRIMSQDMGTPYSGNTVSRNRPPKPSKKREDLRFPDSFLVPSKESASMKANNSMAAAPESVPGSTTGTVDPKNEAKGAQGASGASTQPVKDQTLAVAALLAALGLGGFAFSDYRYRVRLQSILSRNERLLSPDAASSDFDLGVTWNSEAGFLPQRFGGSSDFSNYTSGRLGGSDLAQSIPGILNPLDSVAPRNNEFFAKTI